MQYVQDSFDTGTVIVAWLNPGVLTQLDPMVQRLLIGQQLFVKQSDGSYRPKGWETGLARGFSFSQLCDPALCSRRATKH